MKNIKAKLPLFLFLNSSNSYYLKNNVLLIYCIKYSDL